MLSDRVRSSISVSSGPSHVFLPPPKVNLTFVSWAVDHEGLQCQDSVMRERLCRDRIEMIFPAAMTTVEWIYVYSRNLRATLVQTPIAS